MLASRRIPNIQPSAILLRKAKFATPTDPSHTMLRLFSKGFQPLNFALRRGSAHTMPFVSTSLLGVSKGCQTSPYIVFAKWHSKVVAFVSGK